MHDVSYELIRCGASCVVIRCEVMPIMDVNFTSAPYLRKKIFMCTILVNKWASLVSLLNLFIDILRYSCFSPAREHEWAHSP